MRSTVIDTAAIIAVGSELLTPYRTDSNSLFLTARLNDLAIEVQGKAIVGDDRKRLALAIERGRDCCWHSLAAVFLGKRDGIGNGENSRAQS